jgi:phosphatidylserine/phosphatidylglycerophosphate/cardiolipin synthase-like enzyme
MRPVGLADWIINRFKANNKLQVVVVLPVLPEEIAEGEADAITKHGQALQHEALTKLMTGLGKNLGLYSLLQNKKAPGGKLAFLGSVQIDVHCKIMVVDDLFATIGTANASGRSFELDTEINVGWYEAVSAKKFREDLWKEHLGSASGSLFSAWKTSDYVKEWDVIAGKNAKAKPPLRQGFVVPHDPSLDKGEKMPVLPDFLAEAVHPDQADDSGTEIA